ncbi:MAG: U32 family peptidase, partial [Comamonas sp.]|nr:U32 family peptidase [Comamonas sp.]
MSLLPHQLELLSPARDADIGMEAINHGADAVYIGGPAFGARATAGNDIRDLERLINHAHRFGSRIFITLNTILRDDELEGARQMAWQVYEAGADALIIQDMGLLELDLPPIQLHASTQSDIRTPEKARFLQDAGLSQIVVARELDLKQIAAVRAATDPARTTIEFFVHGALCVAYSGQCYITHAHTGRSANRGDCNQACRLPYEVLDAQGRIIAHEKHVLSMKDNNQSDNLRALIDAGVRSFKIEGRYKDMGYVKNITAHYRKLLDEIIEEREFSDAPLARSSSGRTSFSFTPDPDQNFNREFTDYFVNGRKDDIGAFDTPKTPGRAIGWVTKVGENFVELEASSRDTVLHNGDGLCYYDLQKELVGMQINRAESVDAKKSLWRVFPKDPIAGFKDLRKGLEVNRNRDMAWVRTLDKKSSERRIGLWAQLGQTPDGFTLTLTDDDGFVGSASLVQPHQPATDSERAEAALRDQLGRFGATIFSVHDISLQLDQPWFIPASAL